MMRYFQLIIWCILSKDVVKIKLKICLVTSQWQKSGEWRNKVGWFIKSNPFLLVKSIEFVFSKLLTVRAISIYGDGLVRKLLIVQRKILEWLLFYLLSLPVGLRKKVSEVAELSTFLINLYGKFRGKELVEAFMGSSTQSLELSFVQQQQLYLILIVTLVTIMLKCKILF